MEHVVKMSADGIGAGRIGVSRIGACGISRWNEPVELSPLNNLVNGAATVCW